MAGICLIMYLIIVLFSETSIYFNHYNKIQPIEIKVFELHFEAFKAWGVALYLYLN